MDSVASEPSDITTSVLYSAGTDVGMRREENQDSYGILIGQGYRLFCVADGMGGVQGGSIASNLALASIEKSLRDKADVNVAEVVEAIKEANNQIHLKGNGDPSLSGMGTTIVALLLSNQGAHAIHVGDSRAYQISGAQITRLTEDHTLVQELVRSGAITEEQAEHHPVAHMLTRSLGPSPTVEVESHPLAAGVKQKDRFLLCSDGLYNLVSEAEIAEIVTMHSTDDATQYLIDLANERGGSDNITVIIVDAQEYFMSAPQVEEAPVIALTEEIPATVTEPMAVYPAKGSQRQSAQNTEAASLVGGYHSSDMIEEEQEQVIPASQIEPVAIDPVNIDEQPHQVEEVTPYQEVEDTFAPLPPRERSVWSKVLMVAVSFIGGLLVSYLVFSRGGSEGDSEIVLDRKKPAEGLIIQDAYVPQEEIKNIEVVPPSVPPQQETIFFNEVPRIGPAERSSIQKRKVDLEIQIKDANTKINLLTATSRSEIDALDRQLKHRAEEVKGRIDQLRSDIDVATRKLATWYDRKQRLESVDVVNMASELAVSIPKIKQKKDEFEKATWDYLRAVETLPYASNDVSQREERMRALVQTRATKMKELGDEVRFIVKESLEDADDAVAMLTLQRSSFEKELESIKQELEFVRTATSADSIERNNLVANYEIKREAANMELAELNKLLAH